MLDGAPLEIVITTHQKPDGDAMGSSLGLYHFLMRLRHRVRVVSPSNWADFLKWMPGVDEVYNYEADKALADENIAAAQIIFCLDFNVLDRTKTMEPALIASPAIKVLIDHHLQPQENTYAFGISNPSKSSTCEMVYDFIMGSGHGQLLDQTIAQCLYTGIMTDTGSFRFPGTSPAVHRKVAHLKETGIDHQAIHINIFDSNTENKLKFIGHALLNRLQVFHAHNTSFMSIPSEDVKRFNLNTGDTEGLVYYLQSMKDIRFAALLIDREEERKWSFRSKGNFDVNQFARKHFNGGGHANAAGGRSFLSFEENESAFMQVLETYRAELTAKN